MTATGWLTVSIDADRSWNLPLRWIGLHLNRTATYTPCLVEDTPVSDRDVGCLFAMPLPSLPGNGVMVVALQTPLY